MSITKRLFAPNAPLLRSLEESKSYLRRFRCAFSETDVVLFAAFPKSASQHLKALLGTAFRRHLRIAVPKLSGGFGHNFISPKAVYKHASRSRHLLLYGHIPYTGFNREVVERIDADPKLLVTVRPLADVVVSYKEHVDRNAFGPLDYRVPGAKESFPAWATSSDETKYDYVIRFIVPWFVRFIAGWAEASHGWPAQILTFEEHTGHPEACVAGLAEFLGLPPDQSFVDSLKQRQASPKVNFNVGVGGRGQKLLTEEQHAEIAGLLELQSPALARSPLGTYLLQGYEGLPFDANEVVRARPHQLISIPRSEARAA